MKIDNHVHIGVDPLFYLSGWSPYCLDLPRLQIMTEGSGIDRWVVFPFVSYMALDPEALRREEIRLGLSSDPVPYRFENHRLLGDLARLEPPEREQYLPFLMADPARQPEEQVAVWETLAAEHRVHGIKIQATIIRSPVTELLGGAARMLDFAEERDLPMLIHSSIHPEDPWSRCDDILRIAESRPRVRFILAHSCRFHRPSLDRVAALPNTWFDCSAHIIHCRSAVQGLPNVAVPAERFDTDYASPATVLQDLAAAYPDKLVWGSDAPFYAYEDNTLKLRATYREEVDVLHALPPALQDRVALRNTAAWLGNKPA
jgi:predicted TIM-barrel fold metal-dependent hydrolase